MKRLESPLPFVQATTSWASIGLGIAFSRIPVHDPNAGQLVVVEHCYAIELTLGPAFVTFEWFVRVPDRSRGPAPAVSAGNCDATPSPSPRQGEAISKP